MKRRAFTLLELLVTVTIICILAGIAWGGFHAAMERTRAEATLRTIEKIDLVIQELRDGYETRRVPARPPSGEPPRQWLYNARRDLMRMEMPDRWSDVLNGPLVLIGMTVSVRDGLCKAYDALDDRCVAMRAIWFALE